MRTILAGAIALVLAAAPQADAGSQSVRDLFHTTACTEGDSWRFEWRVQLGIFSSDERAYDFMDDLIARGVAAEVYFTEFTGKKERVVVSPPLRSRGAAKAAARRARTVVGDALVRRYRYWY